MEKQAFTSNWLSNVSVALVVVGGFQNDMPPDTRCIALTIAAVAFVVAKIFAKEG
ncbi:MAG: hypothetical protein IKO41_21525 [Lachnospiraceae bacterium]|nr:hypothetical protein [Lachnospiraceae bacterium]